jgi:hypothetical protein
MNICQHVRNILYYNGITTLELWIKTTWKIAANIREYAAMERRPKKGLPAHGMGEEISHRHRKTAH